MQSYKEFLVLPLDYKTKIAFLSTNDSKSSWSHEINWKFPVNNTKPKMFLENSNEEVKNIEDQKAELQHIAVSEPHDLLAFTTSDKTLFLCKIGAESAEVLSRRSFLRAASVIRFSSCGKFLFLADKTGDTFEYSCEDVNKPATWIFGHISQILDLQLNSDLSFIVTSDRDEKVRVTNYPETHEIEAFCVGHKEFVSSVGFINNDQLLLSASGDKTLRFWNYKSGKEVQRIDLDFVPITVLWSDKFMAISSIDNVIYVYSYEVISDAAVKLHLLGQKTYKSPVDFAATSKTFFVNYVEEIDGKLKLLIDKVDAAGDAATFENFSDVTEAFEVQIEPPFKLFKSFDVSLLFKKRFDNVKQYIDRKKARIETQEAKRK